VTIDVICVVFIFGFFFISLFSLLLHNGQYVSKLLFLNMTLSSTNLSTVKAYRPPCPPAVKSGKLNTLNTLQKRRYWESRAR